MGNCIEICGRKVEVNESQLAQVKELLGMTSTRLADIAVGGTFLIGNHEMVVLEQDKGKTLAIRKSCLGDDVTFGSNNNYNGSKPDGICSQFAEEIEEAVGAENLVEHVVDLTSDDGLKDYGQITRKASLLTAEQYRKCVDVLDQHKLDAYWWLATPHSTARHENDRWAKCVTPSGGLNCGNYIGDFGVRPFCILKSNIFVSM